MNIEAYDAESLRKLVRLLEYENRMLKEKLKKEKQGNFKKRLEIIKRMNC